jgi:proteasome lid subunit RPN8/RPN11
MRTSDWEHIKPGWHELVIVLNEVDRQAQRIEIVDWILTNIQKPDRHCLYTWSHAEFLIKFRYERDYILARLRW